MEQLDPQGIQLPINAVRVPDFEEEIIPAAVERGIALVAMKTCGNGFFFPANATTPDRIERYGPPEGAWDDWHLPTWTDYIHYVLSLPITTATIGIDSYFTLEGIEPPNPLVQLLMSHLQSSMQGPGPGGAPRDIKGQFTPVIEMTEDSL